MSGANFQQSGGAALKRRCLRHAAERRSVRKGWLTEATQISPGHGNQNRRRCAESNHKLTGFSFIASEGELRSNGEKIKPRMDITGDIQLAFFDISCGKERHFSALT
jgi:hypothetical protein